MVLKSKRLERIASLIPSCSCVADIGTDHGMLPVYLVSSGRCRRAIAADVRPGPLSAASRCVRSHGLESSVELRLGSGLTVLRADERPVTVLAGMGGTLICQLLDESLEKARYLSRLILQPNTLEQEVRRYLWEHGFSIQEECAVREGHHVYLILVCQGGGAVRRDTGPLDWYLGEIMWRRGNSSDLEYYRHLLPKIERAVTGLLSAACLNGEGCRRLQLYQTLLESLRQIVFR